MSLIGKKPIDIRKDVKVTVQGDTVLVEGAKGKLTRVLPVRIMVEVKENRVFVTRVGNSKFDKSLHGLIRALIANMIIGVSEGYVKELEIIGTGYKAQVQADILTMQVGYSHPVIVKVPNGIKIEAPKPTHLIIRGIDKELVGGIAAELRAKCPPEPYKGKGIRYVGEVVKKKVGKSQAAGAK